MEKSFGAAIVSVTEVECVADGAVPVTPSGYWPGTVAMVVVTFITDDPPAFTVAGANDAVAPDGKPVAVKVTASGVPLTALVEIVDVPASPGFNVRLAGDAVSEKSLLGDGGPKLNVCTSNVLPESSIGVTVTAEPLTLTFK